MVDMVAVFGATRASAVKDIVYIARARSLLTPTPSGRPSTKRVLSFRIIWLLGLRQCLGFGRFIELLICDFYSTDV